MNWTDKSVVFGLSGLLAATPVLGDVNPPANNSYNVIVERNPFGLRPVPPPAPPPTNAPPVQKSDVKFSGITSDSVRGKEVWLVIPPPPNKKDQNQQSQYLRMRENETQGDIQVLEIDDKENTVKIVNAGNTVVLTIKDNGFTTPTVAAAPGNPLVPHGIPGVMPTPGVLPAPGIVPAPVTPAPGIKTAGLTPTGMPVNEALAARYGLQPTAGGTAVSTPMRTIPTRTLRTTVDPQSQTTALPADPAVQQIMRDATKLHMEQQQGIPYPPLPGGK